MITNILLGVIVLLLLVVIRHLRVVAKNQVSTLKAQQAWFEDIRG